MKKLALLILLITYASLGFSQTPSLIPLPKQIKWDTLFYTIPTVDNRISYNQGAEKAALWVGKLIQPFTKYTYAKDNNTCNWSVAIDTSLTKTLGTEGYMLDITTSGVKIRGAADAGLFYGIQTVRQMLPADIERKIIQGTVRLQCVHIEDAPAYTWRGAMIDIARRFHTYEELRQQIERMALYKLNRLHLHLSDDQGWRIEIKSKPNLTTVGSKSAVGGGTSGFLTQKQYRDLQDYALERHIVIIPEIDMPGHIYAALASYPSDLNCSGNSNLSPLYATPPQPYTGVKVGWSKFCLTKPSIYDFVETVIGEIASITKGPWIHLGGDEIKDDLYGTFIKKAEAIVIKNNKIAIGWEEVLAQDINPSTIGQLWQYNTGNQVNKTILSFCGTFYLDHGNVPGQPNTAVWCADQGVSLEHVYGFQITQANAIGVEGAVWTEQVEGAAELDNRLWPRMIAVAEVAWTQQAQRNLADFIKRIGYHGQRLEDMGCQYYVTPTVNWIKGIPSSPGSVFDNFTPDLDQLNNIGVIEYENFQKFKLFPNPATNIIYMSEVMNKVDVYDFTGKLLSQLTNTNNIKLAGLPDGIYFIQTNKGAAKFIVKR